MSVLPDGILAGLMLATALGIAGFWVTWLRGTHDQAWLPPGYVEHEKAFLPADGLLAALLVAASVLVWTGHALGPSLSLVCAGMLAFLGILDLAYFWRNGLFARARGGLVNAAVVAGVLALAVVLVAAFGRR